ncbi:SPL family radical SAM protein [Fusobacterium necrophorum]|uniref:SPL family radical SAM protein n=1 Tax=Fusobacterium necrophorum TaxID=859 RepID=UPI0021C3033F|nr:radical SAM protein [Fusobacterium necrophorum]
MRTYEMKLWNSNFSHIYVEKEVMKHERSQKIMEKFPKAVIIEIESYQDVFHPSGQEFAYQKQSQKLILARKRDHFLYRGAKVCESFENHHFYYTSFLLNCIYDCDYCYLQGVYSSANIVIFVNLEDFFEEVERRLEETKDLYLCISYDTDLLALEGIHSFVEAWYDFSQKHPGLKIELRTKSAKVLDFSKKPYNPNFILAWTLSPEAVSQMFEKKTPSLQNRLEAIRKWQKQGFFIRLCFDPVLWQKDFEKNYSLFFQYCFSSLDREKILDVSVGTFRISKEYLKKMRKQNRNSLLLSYPFVCEQGVYSYPREIQSKIFDLVQREIKQYVAEEKLFMGGGL